MTGLEAQLTAALERLSGQYGTERRRQSEQGKSLAGAGRGLAAACRAAKCSERNLEEACRDGRAVQDGSTAVGRSGRRSPRSRTHAIPSTCSKWRSADTRSAPVSMAWAAIQMSLVGDGTALRAERRRDPRIPVGGGLAHRHNGDVRIVEEIAHHAGVALVARTVAESRTAAPRARPPTAGSLRRPVRFLLTRSRSRMSCTYAFESSSTLIPTWPRRWSRSV